MANENELGALWIKRGNKGEYMTGNIVINDIATPIVCFTNQNKKSDRHPDWRILRSVPQEKQSNPLPEVDTLSPEEIPF